MIQARPGIPERLTEAYAATRTYAAWQAWKTWSQLMANSSSEVAPNGQAIR